MSANVVRKAVEPPYLRRPRRAGSIQRARRHPRSKQAHALCSPTMFLPRPPRPESTGAWAGGARSRRDGARSSRRTRRRADPPCRARAQPARRSAACPRGADQRRQPPGATQPRARVQPSTRRSREGPRRGRIRGARGARRRTRARGRERKRRRMRRPRASSPAAGRRRLGCARPRLWMARLMQRLPSRRTRETVWTLSPSRRSQARLSARERQTGRRGAQGAPAPNSVVCRGVSERTSKVGVIRMSLYAPACAYTQSSSTNGTGMRRAGAPVISTSKASSGLQAAA
jgi:hypothetical protein